MELVWEPWEGHAQKKFFARFFGLYIPRGCDIIDIWKISISLNGGYGMV
tara:strand:- start:469 stop:615 length:147 start_codon:yes stop_codon:yes gene_type:complete